MLTQLPGVFEEFEEAPAERLLPSCVAGEQRAWRTLHRVYYPVAYAFLRKLGIDTESVEDVCQDVFVQVYRYLPRFRGDSDLKTWLYRVCISEARRFRRKQKVSRIVSTLLGQEQIHEPVTGLDWNERDAGERVLAALKQLPERRRTILVLFDLEGLSGTQIAEVVGCSVQSVWRELHYARSTFMQAFQTTRQEVS